ncbi:uncharacterized protein LOC124429946 [Vespa crabro]|uniref:uncharacterized protein LOC124429946 n=1 Tax=Vespa crabro TaxID=7445 RepID=UPI001F00C2F3|nr:uncharacterized protein LOC124429946 [Vespa crabro]XP_046831801.1 uncharacterized protein LOC124429946 [Vespa crabro]XP_046831803.1 uncharacterized protein LOC124429946 [Vespa crabro]
MKYSSMQGDVYEVGGLPQNRLPDNLYENMMTAANENVELACENSHEESSMVSNLPLLFADGYPTSLEKITLTQLENFITFMVQCSLGHDFNEVITEPQWWPKEVKFSNPLIRPKKMTDNWMANLKKLVFRCYTYHKSEYLLRFCSYLAQYPHEELEYVNNWDSTTSLYHKSTGKLLVTFRNENMNYDKKNDSPRKTLLFHNGIISNFANKSKQQTQSFMMVQPPCDDIYLCDNCDAEFIGLEKMKEHELICCEQQYHETNSSRSTTPDLSTIKSESSQNQFLEYFQLCSREKECKATESNKSEAINMCIATRTSPRVRGSINLTKYRAIPFSSPAGIILAKKSKTMTEETQQERLERIERHVLAPPITSSFRPKWLDKEDDHDRWLTTYKSNRDKPINDYVHQYKFSDSLKGKPMLDINSQILYAACRPLYVILTRLNQTQIEESKRNSLKHSSSAIKPLYKKAGPASKTKLKQYETNLMLKSKISEETELEPMIIEEESMPTTQLKRSITSVNYYSKNRFVSEDKIKEMVPCSVTQKSIMVIDLCSSDEEEISTVHTFNENRDPMNSLFKENLLPNLSTNKVCSKACIYPANSTNHWLMQNIFSEDNENHVNKCHIGGVLDACIQLSPILRPAP